VFYLVLRIETKKKLIPKCIQIIGHGLRESIVRNKLFQKCYRLFWHPWSCGVGEIHPMNSKSLPELKKIPKHVFNISQRK